jgi:hypothetical protein
MSAERVKELLRADYEPGRQDKCKLAVYRNKIKPQTGISERTFWRYMQEIEAEQPVVEDPRQLKLFY